MLANNLFVGPESRAGSKVVDWTGKIDNGTFDYNGYYPDGIFTFNFPLGYRNFSSFAAMQEAGTETSGVLLAPPIFQTGLSLQITPNKVGQHPGMGGAHPHRHRRAQGRQVAVRENPVQCCLGAFPSCSSKQAAPHVSKLALRPMRSESSSGPQNSRAAASAISWLPPLRRRTPDNR